MLKTFSGRNASQNEFELRAFIAYLQSKGVQKYLEVGARHGDTFHEVMCALPVGSYGVAVDLPGALWGTQSSVTALQKVADDLRQRGYVVDVIIGDSTAPPLVKRVASLGPFDAALIDGDHRYKGVKKDWDNYCRHAGIVALHDIVGEGQREKVHRNAVEVPRFWAEVKALNPDKTTEFVDQGSLMGIGVCELR